jgi:hypothetical protein
VGKVEEERKVEVVITIIEHESAVELVDPPYTNSTKTAS